MAGRKRNVCLYNECYLPDNNTKYLIQLVYLIISGLYLVVDEKEFTFFSVLMFTAPILLDLTSTKLEGKVYAFVKETFVFLNSAVAVFCGAGMFGFFIDTGATFAVAQNAMIFRGLNISKRILLIPIILNIFVPVMMYHACPNKAMKKIMKFECARGEDGMK